MKGAAKKILRAARELPKPERVELVEELIAEFDGSDGEVDAAWAAEIDRRTREIDEGKVKPVSWAAVIVGGHRDVVAFLRCGAADRNDATTSRQPR